MGGTNRIGKYLLLESQEETIIGASWRAGELENGKLARNLLADIIDPKLASKPGFLENYLSQSVISKKLEHPNIQKKVESLNEDGQLASIYEYQEGFSLSGVLNRCQTDGFPFSVDHALLVVSKLLSALAYAKGRHITHGFVNPAVVMITHEGEVKLKGFALSSALRSCAGGFPEMDGYYQNFAPPGADMMGDRDQLDIYACGAILFEMLTGQNFNKAPGDPSSKIANAVLEAEGGQIPTQIANILISALDPSAPTAYGDIQKMSKDMEELLYSGEYSPTTFNLAFFMHSAFREEMEALTEKIAEEKERDYSGGAVPPPVRSAPAQVSSAPPTPVKKEAAPTPATSPAAPYAATAVSAPDKQKSKMPLIIGLAVVAAVVVAGFFFMKGGGDGEVDKFEAEKVQLEQEAERLKEEQLAKQQDELRRQNELLREQLNEQEQREKERKKRELQEEMNRMDEEIATLKAIKAQESKQKQIEEQLAALQRQKAEVEKKEKARQEEEKKIQAQKEAEAAILAKQKAAEEAAEEESPAETKPEPKPDTSNNMPVEAPETSVKIVPPQEGDLIPIDDQLLKHPTLLEGYEILDAPKKAVRAGVIPRDKTVLFLMRALVDEDGRVEEAVLYKSPLDPGSDDYGMTEKAKKLTKKLRFSSPTKLGVKVKVWMVVSIQFRGR